MKNINKLILCSFVFVCSTANSAPYVIGQLGGSEVTFTYSTPYSYATSNKTAVIGRIGAGYLWGKNNCPWKYGIEAGFKNYFKVDSDFYQLNMSYHQYQLDALGVLDFHALKRLDLFVKGGAAYARQHLSASYQGYSGAGHINDTFAKGVVGVGFDVTKKANINLSLENNFGFDQGKRNLLLGLQYQFS